MIQAWDNPDCIDRYTIVIEKDIFAMSELPNNPQGVNQFCGSLDSRTPPLTKAWGNQVDIEELPKEVREAINQRKETKG